MLEKRGPIFDQNRAKILLTLVSCFFWGGARFPTKLAQKNTCTTSVLQQKQTQTCTATPFQPCTSRHERKRGSAVTAADKSFRAARTFSEMLTGICSASKARPMPRKLNKHAKNMSVPCSCLSMQAVQCRRQRQSHRQADRQRVEGRGEGKGGQGQAQRGLGREGQGVPQAAPGIHPRSRTRSPHGRCHAPRGSGGT